MGLAICPEDQEAPQENAWSKNTLKGQSPDKSWGAGGLQAPLQHLLHQGPLMSSAVGIVMTPAPHYCS